MSASTRQPSGEVEAATSTRAATSTGPRPSQLLAHPRACACAAGELLHEGPNRALELLNRRVIDARESDRAVQPGVDLTMTESVATMQFSHQAAALPAKLGPSLEGRNRRRLELRHGLARGWHWCGSWSAKEGHLRLELGAQRHEVGRRRRLAGAPLRRLLPALPGLVTLQDVTQLAFDLCGVTAQDRVGGQVEPARLGGRAGIVRTNRPTIWRKISGVFAAVA